MPFIFTFIRECSSSLEGQVGLIEVVADLTRVISCLTRSGVIMLVTGRLTFIWPGRVSADQQGAQHGTVRKWRATDSMVQPTLWRRGIHL